MTFRTGRVFFERLWRPLRGRPIAMASAVVFIALLLLAIFAPLIAPQNPYDVASLYLQDARKPPLTASAHGHFHFWLGSDDLGRDIWSAMLFGLRISLFVGAAATLVSLTLGCLLGLACAWYGGWLDALIMRIADIQLAFPAILLALILLAFLSPGLGNIIVAIVAAQWAYYARTARSAGLSERRQEYVLAASALGMPGWQIALRHVLPNISGPLTVVAAVQVASAIALEATLSFLGLGVPLTEPSLGLLVANGFPYLFSDRYWISFFPGLALTVLVLSLNLVADALRDDAAGPQRRLAIGPAKDTGAPGSPE